MRDNGSSREGFGGSTGSGQIKPSDWTRTEWQVPTHKSFAPEAVHPREGTFEATEGGPTLRLAEPPKWTHRDDLPCTKVVQTGKGRDPFDTNDRKAAGRLCAGCPVMHECLEDAMAQEDGLGPRSRYLIRGGMTPQDRGDRATPRGQSDITSE